MKTKDIQQLIDNPLQPNPTAQAMDVEEILNESNFLSADAKNAIKLTKIHNGIFTNYSDELIAILKRIIKKAESSTNNKSN